jgi:hypothetical protein
MGMATHHDDVYYDHDHRHGATHRRPRSRRAVIMRTPIAVLQSRVPDCSVDTIRPIYEADGISALLEPGEKDERFLLGMNEACSNGQKFDRFCAEAHRRRFQARQTECLRRFLSWCHSVPAFGAMLLLTAGNPDLVANNPALFSTTAANRHFFSTRTYLTILTRCPYCFASAISILLERRWIFAQRTDSVKRVWPPRW